MTKSKNKVVQNALDATTHGIANAGVKPGNYEVTLETVDFTGNRTQTKNMTDAQLKAWLGLIHCGGLYDEAVRDFAGGKRAYQANIDMNPTVTIKPM